MASCWKVVVIDKNVWRIGGNVLRITSYKDEHYTEDSKLANNLLSYWRLKILFGIYFCYFNIGNGKIKVRNKIVNCIKSW